MYNPVKAVMNNSKSTNIKSIYTLSLYNFRVFWKLIHCPFQRKKRQVMDPLACPDCKSIPAYTDQMPACTDYHLYGQTCCVKYVCGGGSCTYTCAACVTENRVAQMDYYDGFTCYQCQQVNPVQIEFHGNARDACDRYCQNGCYHNVILLTGRPALDVQQQILAEAFKQSKPDVKTWMSKYFCEGWTDTDVAIRTMLNDHQWDADIGALERLYKAYADLYLPDRAVRETR